MRDPWLRLVGSILRPARPDLDRCRREREPHLEARRVVAEQRTHALADCERRIETARAEVFAANDGVVTSRMTELERDWRSLSRRDPDGGLMDLWARIAPAAWIDRKRWRTGDPASQLDVAIALASDVDGVDAAEAAIDDLVHALASWGKPVGSLVRWRVTDADSDCVSELLAEPLRAALLELSSRDIESIVLERGQQLKHVVHDAVLSRFPERPLLARGVSQAAFVDAVLQATGPDRRAPTLSLVALWRTGYAISAADDSGVTLEIPPLPDVDQRHA